MAGSVQHRRRKQKTNYFTKFLLWIIALVALAVSVLFFINTFHEDAKNKFIKMSYPIEYSEYVEKAANDYSLDPALIYAIIRTESSFNPKSQSSAGAYGIMQVMPSSFEWLMQLRSEENLYTAEDLFTPAVCIDYGSYLLKYFLDYYKDERCAVAAYNAGFVVSDWLADENYSSDGVSLDAIPYEETSNYVKRVEDAKEMYLELYYQ